MLSQISNTKKLFSALLVLVCTACGSVLAAGLPASSLAPAVALATSTPGWSQDVTGPGGGASVSVSEGVFIVTPGAPLELPLPEGATRYVDEHFTMEEMAPPEVATPPGAMDPADLELPEGVEIIPGATDLTTMDGGMGITVIYFYTTDEPQKVVNFYDKAFVALGYMQISLKGPDAEGKYEGGWMGNGRMITVSAVTEGGRTKILMTLMKM